MRRLLFVLLAAAVGCSAVLGIHDPEVVGEDEAGIALDGGKAHDAAADVVVARNAMVTIPRADGGGTFQIDVDEVTQAQYADFLARGTAGVLQLPACAANVSFVPAANFAPTVLGDHPVAGVDWCDAYAYCQWVGKRLCAGAGGTSGAFADVASPEKNEWLAACTKDGAEAYPYGPAERPTACNTVANDAGAALAVGAKPFCEGGFSGIHDLVGNVAEWIDECDATRCAAMGGSFSSPPSGVVECRTASGFPRLTAYADIGFRCCQ